MSRQYNFQLESKYDDGYELLAMRIIKQICEDYMRALDNHDEESIKETEEYFKSERCRRLLGTTNVTPEDLIRECKRVVNYA